MDNKFSEGMVRSPERAGFLVSVPMHNVAETPEQAAVTVHAVMNGSVVNFWLWRKEQWQRLMPEWQLSGPPTLKMLNGMLLRASGNSEFHISIGADRVQFLLADINIGIQYLERTGEKTYIGY